MREIARKKYHNLFEDEKEIRKTYERNTYQNMTQKEKNRSKKYQRKKNYQEAIYIEFKFDELGINNNKFHGCK